MKVLLLNNQHLGMVVQWEDRFYKVGAGPWLGICIQYCSVIFSS